MAAESPDQLVLLRETASTLKKTAQILYDGSLDFPAVNRNAKRILAAADLIELNVEDADE
ncbi:MAG: hypothetical protein NTY51_02455 [Deltaproteobacteria bacterium]|nr:hypothetical protein [Deltaproteobacteria bacterium]